MRKQPLRPLALLLAGVLCAGLLTACQQTPVENQDTLLAETQIFAMDTIMTLTIHGEESQQALNEATALIYDLEHALSVTDETSDVGRINRGEGAWVSVTPDTAALVSDGLAQCADTGGALDITAYPAVAAWGFTSGEYRVPDQEELDNLAAQIDYTAVEVDREQGQIRLPKGMELDLGAVAKGYTGDRLAQLLEEQGITCAILSLGGNIQAVGSRPDGTPWRVGIQNPDGEDYLGVLEVSDRAVVTSGGYQRYFEEGGQTYWHIMDPQTAAPARSGLSSVTVVGPDGLRCDGLSTALFVMGLEKASDYWRTCQDFQAIFIEEDGTITITAGLEDSFSLVSSYVDREVTVLS